MTNVPRGPRVARMMHELALDEPMSRGITSINVRPDDKQVFGQLQALWSLKKGKQLTQWEAFTMILSDAVAVRRVEIDAAERGDFMP